MTPGQISIGLNTDKTRQRKGKSMATKANVLIIGKHPTHAGDVLRILASAGHSGKSSNTVQGAIDLAESERFDVMLIGGGVPQAEEQEAVAAVRKLIPDIIVKRFYINDEIGPIEIVEGLLAEGPVR